MCLLLDDDHTRMKPRWRCSLVVATTQEPLHLVPKKRNWDLKRDLAKRMAKLDRQTQDAIVELIRLRAQNHQDSGSASEDDDEDEGSAEEAEDARQEQRHTARKPLAD